MLRLQGNLVDQRSFEYSFTRNRGNDRIVKARQRIESERRDVTGH